MAKKTTTKKSSRAGAKKASRKTTSRAKKKVTKKAAAKKKVTKKAASKKKVTKKKVTKKKVAKKAAAKKKATKKAPAKKKVTKKAAAKKTASKKKTAKKAPTKKARGRQSVVEVAMSAEADSDGYVIVNGRRVRRIATDPTKTVKKRRSTADAGAKAAKKNTKPRKSRLTKDDLKDFRTLLLKKRREVLSALTAMEDQALRSDSGDTSHMPIHMADVGSDVFEQDLMLGISASERERIREIDAALERIQSGSYGICEHTGKPIRKARLRAKPWARMSIDAARSNERNGRRY